MAKAFALLVLLVNLSLYRCQEQLVTTENLDLLSNKGKPSYSFGYGASDTQTGDIKTLWEKKEGDIVKGLYSVMEPNESARIVEYSTGPGQVFTAVVDNNDTKSIPTNNSQQSQDRSQREYKPYEFPEDSDFMYPSQERKKKKHSYDSLLKDYSYIKRPKYPMELEATDYSHSIAVKHPRGEGGDAHSHMGFNFNPNCKNKHKKENNKLYTNVADLDFRKHKFPIPYSNYNFEKFNHMSNDDIEKFFHFLNMQDHKSPKPDEIGVPTSVNYNFPVFPDIPPNENIYQDDIIARPKKRYRPHKNSELIYPNEDHDDYILVPKKKVKKSGKPIYLTDYQPDDDEDYDNFAGADDDDRNHKPPRNTGKEVVRKIVKKKTNPVIKLLDIWDI